MSDEEKLAVDAWLKGLKPSQLRETVLDLLDSALDEGRVGIGEDGVPYWVESGDRLGEAQDD